MTRTNVTIANGVLNEDNRIQRWQMIPYSMVKWTPIITVFPSVKEKISICGDGDPFTDQVYRGKFLYLIFDYEYPCSSFAVRRISERIKTSAFHEISGLN